MPIDRVDFESISESDLEELKIGQVPEGLLIEYKRDLYGRSDGKKKEALKDISAFANAFGGHLIIGMAEKKGIPTSLVGLEGIDPDKELNWLQQITRTGISPRIPGIRMRAIPLTNETHAIVLRVPRSWNPPHRVVAANSNRFWIRNSSGAHEASVEELRSLFTLSSMALDKIREFRRQRLKLISEGRRNRSEAKGGRLILHIVPLSGFSLPNQLDLEVVYDNHRLFPVIGISGMSPRFNFEGFINELGGERNSGYVQVFRSGIVEAISNNPVWVVDNGGIKIIPGLGLETEFFKVLDSYFEGLHLLDVSPPLVVMITLDDVEGAIYEAERNSFRLSHENHPIDRNTLFLPDCIIDTYGSKVDYHRAVRPAFDALWNAAGYARSMSFNDEGEWVGQ